MLGEGLSAEIRWSAHFIISFEYRLSWGLLFWIESREESHLGQWLDNCFLKFFRILSTLELLSAVKVFNFCIIVLF